MRLRRHFRARGFRLWQILTGFVLVALGLTIGLQSLVQASDEPDGLSHLGGGGGVRFGISDYAMYGKPISTQQILPKLALADLKPTDAPVTPARLRIPTLGIDSVVEEVGIRDGAMDVPNNIWNVGWLNTSARPGEVGNAVVDGHKDSVKGVAVFWDLPKLKAGDRVYVSDDAGNELTFEVTEVASYLLDDFPSDKVFGLTDQKQLNLISCDGTFIRAEHSYDRRVVVYTRLVENTPLPPEADPEHD